MKYIGKDYPRKAGPELLSGRAKFTGDIKLPGMLYARMKGCPYPRAEIVNIDTSKAEQLAGVRGILTYKNIPEDCFFGDLIAFAPFVRPMEKVTRFVNDIVAVVAAETEEIADEALKLIEIEYKELPAVLSIDEALAEGAPELYSGYAPGNIAQPLPNSPYRNHFLDGDVDGKLKEADKIIDVWDEMNNYQNANPLEPHAAIVDYKPDGTYHLYSCLSGLLYGKMRLVTALNVPGNKVVVEAPYTGAHFGTKLGNAYNIFAALLAKQTGRPVMVKSTKEQHLSYAINRMCSKVHIEIGVMNDGTIKAIRITDYAESGGLLSDQSNMLMVAGGVCPLILKPESYQFDGYVVLTNRQPSGAFRGFGYMEMTGLLGRAMTKTIAALGIDPVEFYAKNALKEGEEYFNSEFGKRCNNTGPDWEKAIRAGAEAFHWDDRFKGWGVPTWVSEDGTRVRGVGMATCGQCSAGSWPSNTDVTIDGYGDVVVKTQLTEQGTGNRDVVVRVVAEVLDISPEHISLSSVTTNDAPTDWGSFGSRSTNTAGMSAMLAAQDLKKKLIQDAEKKLGIPAEDLEFGAGVFTKKSTGETFPLIMTLMMPQNSMSGTGHWDGAEGLTAMSMQYVMVEVDLETGLVKLVDHVSSTDCGCIINPRALNNQFDSFYAGTDVALTEETIYDPRTNHVLNANMIDYKTRTFNGVIPHKNVILESFKDRESVHPFGAFGTAETAISPGGSAISMAIYNACGGIEVPTFPILPGKMLAALKKKKEG